MWGSAAQCIGCRPRVSIDRAVRDNFRAMTSRLSRSRWWSIAVLALCLFGSSSAAFAQAEGEEQARGHFRLGRAHYDNGDFLRAAQEFEAAFAISQHSQLLYNIYLAYRDANVTRKAAEALKGYLEQVEDVPNRAQLAARLQSLEQSLANEPPPTAETPVTTPTETPTTTTSPTETPATTEATPSGTTTSNEPISESSGGSKLVPIILMGSGGALIVGGVITGIMASGKKSDLEAACDGDTSCPQSAEEIQSSGKTLALVTDILLFGGIAVAGTGAVLFLLSGGEESSEPAPASASVVCGPGMCGGSVQLRF